MITFKPVIRNVRADGYAAVYIRVTKDRESDYVKTTYVARRQQLSGKNIKDYTLVAKVSTIIDKYVTRLNFEDTEFWTLREVINFLMQENSQISFNDFFREHTGKMLNDRRNSQYRNYNSAFNSLKAFAGKEHFYFSEITSKLINAWIDSLKDSKRVKNSYPILINAVFKAGTLHYNDYERGILRIKNQPFIHVKIPQAEVPDKRAVEKEDLRKIFNFNTLNTPDLELAQDIAMLVFCLAGINTKDLYVMQTHNFAFGKLCYNRAKTKSERRDRAYIEIAVPDRILPLFEKYRGKNGFLFDFSERFKSSDLFSTKINKLLETICRALEIERVTCYSFRHSWATIAQNGCGANTALVAFALNHATEYRITKGYIKTDFSPIDRLNEQVLKMVFDGINK